MNWMYSDNARTIIEIPNDSSSKAPGKVVSVACNMWIVKKSILF